RIPAQARCCEKPPGSVRRASPRRKESGEQERPSHPEVDDASPCGGIGPPRCPFEGPPHAEPGDEEDCLCDLFDARLSGNRPCPHTLCPPLRHDRDRPPTRF